MLKLRFMFVLLALLCCILLNSCFNDRYYSDVAELGEEVVNEKREEMNKEMSLMYNTLVKENLLPNLFDITLDRKVQEINGSTYVVCHPYTYVDYGLIEDYYNLPKLITYDISWYKKEYDVSLGKYLYFKNFLSDYYIAIGSRNNDNIDEYYIFLKTFVDEINFFKTYYNIENDLITEIEENFSYEDFINDFETNKISCDGKSYCIRKEISTYLSNYTQLIYQYEIRQNKETLKYDFIFCIHYIDSCKEVK